MISPKTSTQAAKFLRRLGASAHSRRISDKILAAFIHAYSLGQIDLADRLMGALHHCNEADDVDRSGEALERAKLWMRFVQARNLYNEIKNSTGEESDEAHEALLAMKVAHRSVIHPPGAPTVITVSTADVAWLD